MEHTKFEIRSRHPDTLTEPRVYGCGAEVPAGTRLAWSWFSEVCTLMRMGKTTEFQQRTGPRTKPEDAPKVKSWPNELAKETTSVKSQKKPSKKSALRRRERLTTSNAAAGQVS